MGLTTRRRTKVRTQGRTNQNCTSLDYHTNFLDGMRGPHHVSGGTFAYNHPLSGVPSLPAATLGPKPSRCDLAAQGVGCVKAVVRGPPPSLEEAVVAATGPPTSVEDAPYGLAGCIVHTHGLRVEGFRG